MAKKKTGVNKSEEIRQLLKANPTISAKDAITALGKKGIEISDNLFYLTKGKVLGRKKRKKRARQVVANVTAAMGAVNSEGVKNAVVKSDVVSTILKVKHLAAEVGGLKKLKALVEALAE